MAAWLGVEGIKTCEQVVLLNFRIWANLTLANLTRERVSYERIM